MRSQIFYVLLASLLSSSTEARRWRFAVPFPGSVEPSPPEPVHKTFNNIKEKEELFDTKQATRRPRTAKVILDEKKEYKLTEEVRVPKIPWIL